MIDTQLCKLCDTYCLVLVLYFLGGCMTCFSCSTIYTNLFPMVVTMCSVKKNPSGLYGHSKLHVLPAAVPFDRFGQWTANSSTAGGCRVFFQVIKTAVVRHTYQAPIIQENSTIAAAAAAQQHSSSTAVRWRGVFLLLFLSSVSCALQTKWGSCFAMLGDTVA